MMRETTSAGLEWVRGASLKPTYLAKGSARTYVRDLVFLSGLRGRAERIFLKTFLWRGPHFPIDQEICFNWKRIEAHYSIKTAFLLYTAYYKDAYFSGIVETARRKTYFIKCYKKHEFAKDEIQRASSIVPIAAAWFRPVRIVDHFENVVAYEFIRHGKRPPARSAVRAAALASCRANWMASSDASMPLRNDVDLLEKLVHFGVKDQSQLKWATIASRLQAPEVPCHGDLTPWNVFSDENGALCLVDYEHVGAGPPYADFFHFYVQPATLASFMTVNLQGLVAEVADSSAKREVEVLHWLRIYLVQQIHRDLDEWMYRCRRHWQLRRLISRKISLLAATYAGA